MTLLSWAVLICAATAGGVVNALAGGGTFLIFPALVFAGVPPISANATASAVVLPGGLASVWAYRSRLNDARLAMTLVAASIAGSLTGSLLLLATSNERFSRLVPWLMLGATLIFSFSGRLRRLAETRAPKMSHRPVLTIGQFFIAIYGGYFGAGMGVLMVVLFLIAEKLDVQASAAFRLSCGSAINLLAVLVFAWKGIIDWQVGVPMLIAAIVGGYAGARAVERLSAKVARRTVLMYAWATSLWLLARSW